MKLNEIVRDSRTAFNETWLSEMPEGLGAFETFDTIEYSINDFIKHGIKPEELTSSLRRIVTDNTLLYWYEKSGEILIGTELHKKAEGLVVSITGKNPKIKGSAPFASDLYSDILKYSGKSMRILSDSQLSDEGFVLWKKMLKLGHKISVYDKTQPGKSFKSFENESEFDDYFKHDDISFRNFQYVLSEEILDYCAMRSSFRLRLHREKSNLSLKDKQ